MSWWFCKACFPQDQESWTQTAEPPSNHSIITPEDRTVRAPPDTLGLSPNLLTRGQSSRDPDPSAWVYGSLAWVGFRVRRVEIPLSSIAPHAASQSKFSMLLGCRIHSATGRECWTQQSLIHSVVNSLGTVSLLHSSKTGWKDKGRGTPPHYHNSQLLKPNIVNRSDIILTKNWLSPFSGTHYHSAEFVGNENL